MKRKIFSVLFALVLVLSFSLVMAVPVAADVTSAAVTVAPLTTSTADADYTIVFDVTAGLAADNVITIVFPSDTAVVDATTITGTVQSDEVAADAIESGEGVGVSATRTVTVIVPTNFTTITDTGTVTLVLTAGITNPTTEGINYTLQVKTSVETTLVTSASYTIGVLPDVDGVFPSSGNAGDTMWVEVTGSDFVEGETTFDFGTGITVVSGSYHWISATEMDVQIMITAAAGEDARDVVPTTWGEGTNTSAQFDPNAAGTPQVDVWEAYDITADPLVAGSLDFDQTTTTIQGAEDVCDATETVIVHAAIYEGVGIDQTITLLSLSGADSTIIDGGSSTYVVDVSKKVTIDGFTIKGDAATTLQIGIRVRGSNVNGFAIQNNKFVDIIKDNIFVTSIDGAITSGLIDLNTFTGLGEDSAAYRAAILVETYSTFAIDDVTISNNTISNYGGVETSGIALAEGNGEMGASTAMTVSGNQVSNTSFGFSLWNDVEAEITDNTFTGGDVGVDIFGDDSAIVAEFTLSQNTITGNTSYGIRFHGPGGASITGANMIIKYNDISGNGDGILVDFATVTNDVVALYNYWGDPSGPTITATNPRGAGDTVGTDVVYEPWLHTTQATVVAANTRYYAYNLVSLQQGWNIFSTPIALDEQAATWSNYKTLGVPLALDSGSSAYYFDASLSTPAWDIVTASYVLRPSDAIYIKMASAQVSPILFSPSVSAPSKMLYPGWNLVSASYFADLDAPAISGEIAIETALASVYYATGASNIGYSVVTSPAVNQAAWSGVRGATISADFGTDDMIPTKGYWVHMVNGGTLVGAVFTPVSPLIAGP